MHKQLTAIRVISRLGDHNPDFFFLRKGRNEEDGMEFLGQAVSIPWVYHALNTNKTSIVKCI